jgi:hypothetical protein
MYPNIYAIERQAQDVVRERVAQARKDQLIRMAEAARRELQVLRRRQAGQKPARAIPAV